MAEAAAGMRAGNVPIVDAKLLGALPGESPTS